MYFNFVSVKLKTGMRFPWKTGNMLCELCRTNVRVYNFRKRCSSMFCKNATSIEENIDFVI